MVHSLYTFKCNKSLSHKSIGGFIPNQYYGNYWWQWLALCMAAQATPNHLIYACSGLGLSISINEKSSSLIWDKQESTYRILKCKKTELELAWNETAKSFKGLKGKIHAQDEVESPLKAWENVKLNTLQIKTHSYTTY